jgi:nucleotide-binding universal stress UspA family protein
VLATDGSDASEAALAWAAHLAQAIDAKATIVTVMQAMAGYDYLGGATASILGAETKAAEMILEEAAARIADDGPVPETVATSGSPWREIRRVAQDREADLVIVGSHGRTGLKRFLLGSVADGVKNHAECPVLIARKAPPPKQVLIPVDGSVDAATAAQVGLRLAWALGAGATFVHVVPGPEFLAMTDAYEDLARKAADADLPQWKERGVATVLKVGNVAQAILEEAEARGADLIVMGSTGEGAYEGTQIGSVSNRVAHQASASVLLTRKAS